MLLCTVMFASAGSSEANPVSARSRWRMAPSYSMRINWPGGAVWVAICRYDLQGFAACMAGIRDGQVGGSVKVHGQQVRDLDEHFLRRIFYIRREHHGPFDF